MLSLYLNSKCSMLSVSVGSVDECSYLIQDSVQLGGAVDEGAQVHADQPQMGPGLGVITVC